MHLVGVGNEQCPLAGTVVVQNVHDLHSCVCLPGSRWPHHHREAWLCASSDGFHLHSADVFHEQQRGTLLG